MKFSCFVLPVVQRNSHRWCFEATDLCSSTMLMLKQDFLLKSGKVLLPMVSLVIISTTDLDDDWMPGSRAPGLFVFAPQSSRENEGGQKEWGHFLDYAAPSYRIFGSHRRGSTWVLYSPLTNPPAKTADFSAVGNAKVLMGFTIGTWSNVTCMGVVSLNRFVSCN